MIAREDIKKSTYNLTKQKKVNRFQKMMNAIR